MGVNGIYGLSGSGLDVESMVKVGMLSKQSEYEKMQQKYTKDEWKKTELLSLYGEIQTFNASTLSKYKMSSTMNSREAASSNSSAVTATANANAATMTHYVEVSGLASSAYLIGTTSPTRLNTDSSEKTQLSSVLFNSIEAVEGDSNKVKVNGVEKNADDVAFSFSINDGVNGILTSSDSDAVVASATPDSATGTYKVAVTNATTTGTLKSGFTENTNVYALFSDSGTVTNKITSHINNADTALTFTFNDGTTSKYISFTYGDLKSDAATFISNLNSKFKSEGLTLEASLNSEGSSGGISLTNTNGKIAKESTFTVSTGTNPIDNGTYRSAGFFLKSLFVGNQSGINDADTSATYTASGTISVTDENDNAVAVTVTGKTATTADGITFTAKTLTTGTEITNEGTQNVSVTYRELLDGYTFNDLTSKINTMGTNVRANYDSVQDRFSFYNKKSGEKNQINISIGTSEAAGDAADNAAKFFNSLGLQQSSNGEIVGSALKFDADNKTISQTGVNASAKVDGVEYNNLDSNNVSVDGVTYTFQNETTSKVAVTVTQDTESIIKNVQSFVDDYNALLKKLYEWYDEKPNSDYKPLTETQKSSMKEEQIEKWEKKAKAGMLYHDKTLGNVISELRSAVSENVEGVDGKYKNIFSIGISTTGLKGQLTLDTDKLKAALAEDPDAVYNVFAKLDGGEKQYLLEDESGRQFWSTNASQAGCTAVIEDGKAVTKTVERSSYNGIAQRLGDVFVSSMKSVKKVSGSTASITEDSELNNLMRELQTKMSNFKRMMQAFEDRLYKKYDAMESSLALLGSQLNYVTSAFQ